MANETTNPNAKNMCRQIQVYTKIYLLNTKNGQKIVRAAPIMNRPIRIKRAGTNIFFKFYIYNYVYVICGYARWNRKIDVST